jgi:hypothetical protein
VRRPIAIILALLMVGLLAAPAQAATVHRVFNASVGTNGANGRANITAYTDGTGGVYYGLKGLKAGWTYRVEVRKGRCNNLGTVITRLSSVKASSTGGVYLSRPLSTNTMFPIWQANWSNRLAIRFVSGSSIRCGNLNFVSATRVRVPSQGVLNTTIDMAVVRGPSGYPYCNVAMYMGALNQPTEPAPGATFIFAHARSGMFLPLLKQWQKNKGVDLIGKLAYVWTSNNKVHVYEIYLVKQTNDVQSAVGEIADRLWLQTSTGPNYTYPKLVIKAKRIETRSVTYESAHPTARPVSCG